jgi:Ca2+-binding EF-hand superfamily protein
MTDIPTPEVVLKPHLALLCSAALLSTAALADDDTQRTKASSDSFAALDADGDGKVSKDEAAGHEDIVNSFDRLDRDRDGFVTKREFRRNTMPKPKPSY